MVINAPNLDALYYTFKFVFDQAFGETPTFYNRLCTTIPSAGRENRYPMLGLLAMPREWYGERVYHNLASMNYTLVNRLFELSVRVPRIAIADDQYSYFSSVAVPQMAENMKRNPDLMLVDLLRNGDSSSDSRYLAFDGQPFFNGSHPVDMFDSTAGTYSNLFTTTAFSSANFNTVRTAMGKYKGSNGTPLLASPNLIVVPKALEVTARTMLQATTTAYTTAVAGNAANVSTGNPFVGMADLLVLDYLNAGGAEDTTWYVFDTSKRVKPFIYQPREAATLKALTSPTDVNVFARNEFLYGTDCREAMGFTLPFLGAKATA